MIWDWSIFRPGPGAVAKKDGAFDDTLSVPPSRGETCKAGKAVADDEEEGTNNPPRSVQLGSDLKLLDQTISRLRREFGWWFVLSGSDDDNLDDDEDDADKGSKL